MELTFTTTEGVPVAGEAPEETKAIRDSIKKKATKTESRSPLSTVNACTVSGQSIPGKIWMPTNQITGTRAHAHVYRE